MYPRFSLLLVLIAWAYGSLNSQEYPKGLEIRVRELTDSTIKLPRQEFYLSPAIVDAKSIGMGKTGLANGKSYIGMLHNPALLSRQKVGFELTDAQVVLPKSTIDAIQFINSTSGSPAKGEFLRIMKEGAGQLMQGELDPALEKELIDVINTSATHAKKFMDNTIGEPGNLKLHGLSAYPNLKFQYKNFGFALHSTIQTTFAVNAGQLFNFYSNIHLPDDFSEINEERLIELAALLATSVDHQGNIDPNVLPQFYSVTMLDVIGTLGYAHDVNEQLSLGASLNVINRRMSAALITVDEFDKFLSEYLSGLNKSQTSLNITLGGLYKTSFGAELAISAANILPEKTIASNVSLTSTRSTLLTDLDGMDLTRDTLQLDIQAQDIIENIEFARKTPFLLNVGVMYPIGENLDIALEWVDILQKDQVNYNQYFDRIRIGAEYRLFKNRISLRSGLAELKPTAGVGLNFGRKSLRFEIDGAAAYQGLTQSYAYFLQLKFAFDKQEN